MEQIIFKSWTYNRAVLERMCERDLSFASGKIDCKEIRKGRILSEGYWDKFHLYLSRPTFLPLSKSNVELPNTALWVGKEEENSNKKQCRIWPSEPAALEDSRSELELRKCGVAWLLDCSFRHRGGKPFFC